MGIFYDSNKIFTKWPSTAMSFCFTIFICFAELAYADYQLDTREAPSNFGPYRQRWIEDIHQTDELWSIHNWTSFESKMLGKGVSLTDLQKIKTAYQPQIGDDPPADAAGVFGLFGEKLAKHVAGHVIADDALIRSLSPDTVKAVHAYTVDSGYFIRVLSADFYGSIRTGLEGIDASEETIAAIEKQLVKGHFNSAVPATKENWPTLPYKLRERIVDQMFSARNILNVTLRFKNSSDVDQIANDFSMGRNPETLKRFLRKKLAQNQNQEVAIPLETILTPFIRDTIDTYHLIGGANCTNAACAANAGKYYKQAFLSMDDFTSDLEKYFRPLGENEQRHAGDMMVFYEDEMPRPKHAAIVISEEIVFTKNGHNRASPYQFQKTNDLPVIYGTNVKYFRRIGAYHMQSNPSLRGPARRQQRQNECLKFYIH